MPFLSGVDWERLLNPVVTIATGLGSAILVYIRTIYKADLELHRRQLHDLYEPLIGIYMQKKKKFTEDQVVQINDLICKHNSFCAPALIEEWNKWNEKKTKSEPEQFYSILLSNYNWVRKCLGYPFDEKKIDRSNLPVRGLDKRMQISTMVGVLIGMVASVLAAWNTSDLLFKIEVGILLLLGMIIIGYVLHQMKKESGII